MSDDERFVWWWWRDEPYHTGRYDSLLHAVRASTDTRQGARTVCGRLIPDRHVVWVTGAGTVTTCKPCAAHGPS